MNAGYASIRTTWSLARVETTSSTYGQVAEAEGSQTFTYDLSLTIGLLTLKLSALLRRILTFASLMREDSMFGTNPSLKEIRESLPSSTPLFPRVLVIAQPDFTRRDTTAGGTKRTLSRIDGAFINLLMTEARDFHCYSHVLENLGKRFIPSDHAAVCVVIQKTTTRGNQGKRIPSWMSKHPVFCSILKQLSDDH